MQPRRGAENAKLHFASVPRISPLFQAAPEAVEESVYNSLLFAHTMTGNGNTIKALPLDRLTAMLKQS